MKHALKKMQYRFAVVYETPSINHLIWPEAIPEKDYKRFFYFSERALDNFIVPLETFRKVSLPKCQGGQPSVNHIIY